MTRLSRKLTRELSLSRWQLVAIAATVMLGIGFFQGALVSYRNLGKSYELTYKVLAFAHVWAPMAAAPDSLVRRVERLPGVRVATGRIVEEIRVSLRDRPVGEVLGRLISLPADRQPDINRVRVVEGRYFSPQSGREALLELSFARAHDYHIGEYIWPTIRGQEIRFRVVGLAQSPEYIYSVQSEQYLVPTPDTFGVIFIPERQAEALLDMAGTINEICVIAEHGQMDAVAKRMESITKRYGGSDPITRDEQPSNELLMADLDGYRQMAVIFPLLFLTGTVLTTYTLLARMVQAQAPQIGVLRAIGFGQRAILVHYLSLAAIPALSGGVLGIGLGYLFAWWITRLYVVLINVPYMFFEPQTGLAVIALVIAAGAGLAGALSPARAAAGLPPAKAMSQQAIAAGQPPLAVRWFGAGLPLGLKLPLRNLIRRPRRVGYSVLGITLGVCLMLVSLAMLDAVEDSIVTFFEELERYDLSVGFASEQPGRTVTHIANWPGVARAEPTLDIAVDLERGDTRHSTILAALPPDGQLRRLTDESGRPVRPKPGEVLLGKMLRTKFKVTEGDLIQINYAQNTREFQVVRSARVGPHISQPIGSMVYMRLDDVQRLFAHRLGMPLGAASGALILSEPGAIEAIGRRLHRMPAVAAVLTRAQTYSQIQELMRFTKAFTAVLACFGVALASAVVFTTVSINVLERSRELATLRTIGFGFRRIAGFTTVENLLAAAAGALLGLPLGRLIHIYLMTSMQSESVSLEPIIYLRTYLIVVLGLILLTIVSQIPSLLHIRRMNLAAETKQLAA